MRHSLVDRKADCQIGNASQDPDIWSLAGHPQKLTLTNGLRCAENLNL
jgi:hypothetical protein